MNNALLLALSGNFPLWEECLEHNLQFDVKTVLVRLDGSFNDKKQINRLSEILKGKDVGVFRSDKEMNKWNWREELLENLHVNRMHDTDYVLFPDEDEKLPEGLTLEGKGQFMFDYEMITDDGRDVFKYPAKPHSKAFSYDMNLTYFPYFHFARVGKDGRPYKEISYNKGKIRHYCFYKKEWEDGKIKSINSRYPDYFAKFGGK